MNVFDVYVNNRKVCSAGIPEPGVVTAILTWVARETKNTPESIDLHIGGLISRSQAHLHWGRRTIKAGDEIRVVVFDRNKVSKPKKIQSEPAATQTKRKVEYLKRLSKELGYEVKKKRT